MSNNYDSMFREIVDNKMSNLCEDTRRRLKSYIEYEFTIANMELASRQKKHGDDFKSMPDSMVQQIRTSIVKAGNTYSVHLSIGNESLQGVSDDIIDFFKNYVITNAQERLTYGVT